MRGRSYTPSPPRGYGRRGRSPSPRGRYGGGRSRDLPSRDLPTSLLVRNLRHDCRPDDLRRQFGPFGQLKDIYLPRDYYSGEPRGFGFVQFVDPNDAAEAKYHMDGYVLLGRELTVVFAEENRKKPNQMRQRDRGTGSRGSSRYDRGRSPPPRSSRYSRSPPPARHPRSRSRSHGYDSPPPKRRHSRSPSLPQEKRRDSRERSYTPPRHKYSRTPPMAGSRSRSQSLNAGGRSLSPIPVRGRSRSRSPPVENYARDNNGGGDRSPSQ